MNQWAWNYYTADGSLRNETEVARNSFRRAIALNPFHPLALHLTIHLLEPSTNLDVLHELLLAANALNSTITAYTAQRPGTGHGHLIHMPGHAYLRTGNYHGAVVANERGIQDDEIYFTNQNISLISYYRELYFCHKHAFLIYSSAMEGSSSKALQRSGSIPARPHHRLYAITMNQVRPPCPLFFFFSCTIPYLTNAVLFVQHLQFQTQAVSLRIRKPL